ncbi:STAS domain-containing protein [Kitasatospora mediocidica]|uniref:STAS domain-containing protein n=1 Tax=Kitasatospora mediocidica TaxID=58352 RepID=UPI00056423EA|nr:STAS domain-containing protein [Kitasatospora mediocidica]
MSVSVPLPEDSVELSVTCVLRGELAVLSVAGELDVATAPLLWQHLADQLAHGRRHLVVDLEGVPFMDSSGLNVIIRAMRETGLADGSLALAAPTPPVFNLFRLTGISRTQPIHRDVESAVVSLCLNLMMSEPPRYEVASVASAQP